MSSQKAIRTRGTTFTWGARTYVMGIVNVTPDSFSGDGLLRSPGPTTPPAPSASPVRLPESAAPSRTDLPDPVVAAVEQARRMVAEGANILDVGGESTRPGHLPVDADEELERVLPVVRAIRAALPDVPISIDTAKPEVASAALDAGADWINDVWGTGPSDDLPRLAAARHAPYVLMHNRAEARYDDVLADVLADLAAALDRAIGVGLPRDAIVVDPGIGFGKTMEHNLVLLRRLGELRGLGRPILLGASRKSTIGRLLGGVPPSERVEGTLAITALGIGAGVDIVRVHDVLENVRVARVADAIVRAGLRDGDAPPAAGRERASGHGAGEPRDGDAGGRARR